MDNLWSQLKVVEAAAVSGYSAAELVGELCGQFAAASLPLPENLLGQAVSRYANLVNGSRPGILPLDTPYHDVQHSIDVTRCTAALLIADAQIGTHPLTEFGERALVTLICALFHDTGYLRHASETQVHCGALLIKQHVSRSVQHAQELLQDLGLAAWRDAAEAIIHCTGYERSFASLQFPCESARSMGQLVGTADLIAQMADPVYPEKVRDRLYLEFEVAGLAGPTAKATGTGPGTAAELLRSTPTFIKTAFRDRLDTLFESNYRLLKDASGRNTYLDQIHSNLQRIEQSIDNGPAAIPLLAARQLPPPSLRIAGDQHLQQRAPVLATVRHSKQA